jgi:hypothetical protein
MCIRDRGRMRTAVDVLSDPKAGDIIDVEPNWRRWVIQVTDRGVIYNAVNNNKVFDNCDATLEGWRIVCRLPTVKVLHVAE